MRYDPRKKGQRGAAVVEFAVIAPLLLVIIFGIIEFGVYFFDKAVITNASREGARTGIVYGGPSVPRVSDDDIEAVVMKYEDSLISFHDDDDLDISISRSGNSSGDTLTVRVEYPFRFLVFSNLLGLLGGDIANPELKAVTVMRLE
jgi:Flp pilus assembly protein TadG